VASILTAAGVAAEFIRVTFKPLALLPACFIPIVLGQPAKASDWPQWRGPSRSGHVPAGVALPGTLPSEPKMAWRLKIGEGLASPVVAGGRLFYFVNTEGQETLHALDTATCRELWRAAVDAPFSDMQGPTGPRCTPLVDGDRVYAVSCKQSIVMICSREGRWTVTACMPSRARASCSAGAWRRAGCSGA
jgi:hypothetical protein